MSIRVLLGCLLPVLTGMAAAGERPTAEVGRFAVDATRLQVEPKANGTGRFTISGQVTKQRGIIDAAPEQRFEVSAALTRADELTGVCLPEIFKDGFEPISLPPPPDPIVRFDNVNFSFPATLAGGSINWATGETCTCDTPPFNFNAYASGGSIAFFWPAEPPEGAVVMNSTYQVLGPGAVIGPASTFSTAASAAPWAAGTIGFLGFRFAIPPSTQVNYGYARISTTGVSGFPATLLSYAYDRTGNAITIPQP